MYLELGEHHKQLGKNIITQYVKTYYYYKIINIKILLISMKSRDGDSLEKIAY